MEVSLIGSFVFLDQGYGVLSGIYHNNKMPDPHPETAKRKGEQIDKSDPFVGEFTTIWIEDQIQEDKTGLKITKTQNGTYQLIWYDDKKTYYQGVGFRHNNELVGSYWQLA